MKIIDLSHEIYPGMPVYPGDSPPEMHVVDSIVAAGSRETSMRIGTHIGTHLDVPAHVFRKGTTLERFPAENFVGPGCRIDLTPLKGPLITSENLLPHMAMMAHNDFVLLHTGWSRLWGSADYFTAFPTLSLKAAALLSTLPIKGIGLDTPSADRSKDLDLPVHRKILKKNILLIENLTRLEKLPPEGFLFTCLPVKIKRGDGFPVRAVAVFL